MQSAQAVGTPLVGDPVSTASGNVVAESRPIMGQRYCPQTSGEIMNAANQNSEFKHYGFDTNFK